MTHKILFISAAPIQNAAPFRLLEQKQDINITVAYCSLPQREMKKSREYINQQAFDIEVLDKGYPWVHVRNYSPFPGLGHFLGLFNPGLFPLILQHDTVVIYGHAYLSFVLSILLAKLSRKKLILTSDATHIEPPDGRNWKIKLKKIFFPLLYNQLAHHVFVPSNKARKFMLSVGVKEDRITRTGYTVDNDFIQQISLSTKVSTTRQQLGVPQDALLVIFCAKFIDRKRPLDTLRAFIKADVPGTYLLMIGDGPLKPRLEDEAREAGMASRVILPGLIKYSRLPEFYTASNLFVFSSETEQFGLPVNEAMICGLPSLLSDQIGAIHDLMEEGVTGYSYPCGDIDAFSRKLQQMLSNPEQLKTMGHQAREKIQAYSPAFNANNIYEAVRRLHEPGTGQKYAGA
jgi:glycosyltransferase involved in cell wall biosynthesis